MIPADDDFMGGIARRDFMNSASLRFIHRDQLESEGTASPAVEVAAAIPVKLQQFLSSFGVPGRR
jgi:hypothetical protein